jgi:outer membrane protein TolC
MRIPIVLATLGVVTLLRLVLPAPVLAQPPAPATQPPAPGTPAAQPTAKPAPSPAPSTATPQPSQPRATAATVAGRVLTLDDAVSISLETQPQIQARLYDYAAARFRVDQALSPLLPQVSASWSASKSQTPTTSTTGGVTVVRRDFNQVALAQISLSQLLFDFGKTLAATEATRKLAAVSFEDLELQRQLLALAVKEAYTRLLVFQRLILVDQQALERAQLNLRSAKGFYEVGTRPRSDVARAEVDVANANQQLIADRGNEQLQRVALNTAMGIDVDTPTQVQDNLAYEPVHYDRLELRADALSQRPEYRQAKLQVDAAEALARRAFRDFFPDITGSAAYGGARFTFEEQWSLILSLSWSIYDGGNRIARLREAKVNVDGAVARVRATELDIVNSVEQAYISVITADESIRAAQIAVASAQENFRLAQGRFDAGVGTILELTDAQLALTQAQQTESAALGNYRIAIYQLDRARGRR